MAIDRRTSNVLIGSGLAYVDLLDAAGQTTGERDLGECASMRISVDVQRVMVYSAQGATARKLIDAVTQRTYSAQIAVRDMDRDNLALWLGGDASTEEDAATAVVDEVITVQPGRSYQLGASPAKPMGYLELDASVDVAVTYGATAAAATTAATEGTDFDVDPANARIHIRGDGAISADDVVKVDYTPLARTHSRAATPARPKEIRAAIRYVEDGTASPGGRGRNVYIRDASVGAAGDLALMDGRSGPIEATLTLGVQEPASGSALMIDGRALAAD